MPIAEIPNELRRRLLTYAQLSRLLALPTGTLYSLVHREKIPYIRLGRRTVRFDAEEISAWLDQQRCAPGGGTEPEAGR